MPWYVGHGSQIEVPSVIGLPIEHATRLLDSLGFQPREGETRASQEYPPGTVIIQNPLPGALVKEGRRVYLSISGGEQLVTVPPLRGKTVRDARFALERNGLRFGETVFSPSAELPANTIIDQSIPPGKKVRKGLLVSIVVSQGAATDEVEVPDLIGKPLTEAGKILADRGLKVGQISYQVASGLLPNTVVDQYPRGRAMVGFGESVDLFVVEAGGKKQPPTEN